MPSPLPPPTTTWTVTSSPLAIASSSMTHVALTNTGTKPVRLLSNPGDADHGRTVAPGATVELTTAGRTGTLRVTCDGTSTIEFTRYSLADLRQSAADYFHLPVEMITGRDKAEVSASVARLTARERTDNGATDAVTWE